MQASQAEMEAQSQSIKHMSICNKHSIPFVRIPACSGSLAVGETDVNRDTLLSTLHALETLSEKKDGMFYKHDVVVGMSASREPRQLTGTCSASGRN